MSRVGDAGWDGTGRDGCSAVEGLGRAPSATRSRRCTHPATYGVHGPHAPTSWASETGQREAPDCAHHAPAQCPPGRLDGRLPRHASVRAATPRRHACAPRTRPPTHQVLQPALLVLRAARRFVSAVHPDCGGAFVLGGRGDAGDGSVRFGPEMDQPAALDNAACRPGPLRPPPRPTTTPTTTPRGRLLLCVCRRVACRAACKGPSPLQPVSSAFCGL